MDLTEFLTQNNEFSSKPVHYCKYFHLLHARVRIYSMIISFTRRCYCCNPLVWFRLRSYHCFCVGRLHAVEICVHTSRAQSLSRQSARRAAYSTVPRVFELEHRLLQARPRVNSPQRGRRRRYQPERSGAGEQPPYGIWHLDTTASPNRAANRHRFFQ